MLLETAMPRVQNGLPAVNWKEQNELIT